MRIKLSPQRRDDQVTVIKSGDLLTINGEAFDLSVIPDGAELPAQAVACEFVTGVVTRIDGVLNVTLILPHGPNPSQSVAFPPALVNPPDGLLALPFDPPEEVVPFDLAALIPQPAPEGASND